MNETVKTAAFVVAAVGLVVAASVTAPERRTASVFSDEGEAFYPDLFDELGFPYTGSDAWVLAVTLDKSLTKLMLSEHGVISPRGQFIDDLADLKLDGWRFPLMVKPNFEGSSKGITQDSIVEDRSKLRGLVEKQLSRFPAGVLVEEFIPGKDLTVAFLEKAGLGR